MVKRMNQSTAQTSEARLNANDVSMITNVIGFAKMNQEAKKELLTKLINLERELLYGTITPEMGDKQVKDAFRRTVGVSEK